MKEYRWDLDFGTRVVLEGVEHGIRSSYARGCQCPSCTEANTIYNKQWHTDNVQQSRNIKIRAYQKKKEVLNNIKLASGCVDCNYNEHPEALDFDHVRGVKLFNISTARNRKLEEMLLEIAKCEIVCAICHRIRTMKRRKGDEVVNTVPQTTPEMLRKLADWMEMNEMGQ